jgi:hypothetical protein
MRKKTKINPQLLNEELKKFRLLSEYSFYTGEEVKPEYEKPLILGDLEEAEGDDEAAAADIAKDLGVEAPEADNNPGNEEPATDDKPADEEGDLGDMDFGGDEETPEETPEEPIADDSNDVEIDVTSLVKGSEEAKAAADKATQNTEMLLQKLSDLESRIASMDALSTKIEDLEQEIVKRNPTPVEKLEMRSLSSAPFNQKLTDYWADKEGAYDVMGNDKKPKEYVLTKDDVDSTYSDSGIRKTFAIDDNPYDEESIKDYDEEDI